MKLLINDQLVDFSQHTNLLTLAKQLLTASQFKALIAAKIDAQLVDLSFSSKDLPAQLDAPVKLTWVFEDDPEGLEIIRHSTAHLLAQAVTELFSDVQPTVGPAITDGFYHDFYVPGGLHEKDLEAIELRMHQLAQQNLPIQRSVISQPEAVQYFKDKNQHFKVLMAQDIPPQEPVSFYTQGTFTNMCRGPHVISTGRLKHFKLTKLAGAYWRGDAKNEMLYRIYGTAWASAADLDAYLTNLAEAKNRDHRQLGKTMDLFHLQEEAPGMVFWHPNGWAIYSTIKHYLEPKLRAFGYREVNTPMIVDRSLWERSGHWDKYREVMFTTQTEGHTYAIKPMNCPDHIQIFKQDLRSYRDLPIRYAEFGSCHRNEVSGSLHGLMRVRGFAQDDGHIFCTPSQIASESSRFIAQLLEVYKDFGFTDLEVKLSTRPAQRIGSDEIWDRAEQALSEVLNAAHLNWEISEGEGAFYGPKIEFALKDCLKRVWQCGTLQVDFFMPERLGATYIDENGNKQHPVMLHRAMLGSLERFIGILLEQHAGRLPLWLAPIQVMILTITNQQDTYATSVHQKLEALNYRAACDLSHEKIGLKIRQHTVAKVPIFIIIGAQEAANNTVSVRLHDGANLGSMSLDGFVKEVLEPRIEAKN